MIPLVENWAGGVLAIIGSVGLQLCAQLFLLGLFARWSPRKGGRRRHDVSGAWLLSAGTVLVLILGHLAQVLVWTVLFVSLGQLADFRDAAYFSLASYTTIGTADLALSPSHRMLDALEAGVGVLMFGWSGAILVVLVGLIQAEHAPRR